MQADECGWTQTSFMNQCGSDSRINLILSEKSIDEFNRLIGFDFIGLNLYTLRSL